jgi:hypothetical protein
VQGRPRHVWRSHLRICQQGEADMDDGNDDDGMDLGGELGEDDGGEFEDDDDA